MASRSDLRRYFILLILSIFDSRKTYGYPGRIESDGSATFDVPGKPGYTYVTIWRGQKLVVDQAINIGASPNPNLLVEMERIRGVLTVVRADPLSAAQAFGTLVGSAGVPKHTHAIGSGLDDPVEGRRFLPGLLAPSASGGLTVYVRPFFTKYGYVAENTAFAIDDPSTAGTRAWVVVYADDSNTLQYTVSATHVTGTTGLLDEADISSEITLPDGATPVGAVVVAAGGAVTVDNQFADYRFHFDHNDLFGGLGNVSDLTEDTAPDKSADFAITSDVSDSGNPKKVLIHRLNWLRPLSVNVTEVGNVGTGEDDLMTYTVAANTLGTNLDRLQIKAAGTFAAATVRLRAYLDDTLLFDTGSIAVAGSSDWELDVQIIREAQSVQKCTAKFASSAAVLPVTANYAGAAEDLSTSLVFKLTAEATNNNDVVQELMTVDLVRAP